MTVSKLGPGEYQPDVAFLRMEDLPKPEIIKESRNESHRPCPRCHQPAPREHVYLRRLHDVGDLVSGRPCERHITYSQNYCKACRKYFSADLTDAAPRGSHYTHRVIALALRVVVEDSPILSECQLAPLARSSSLCHLRDDPELDRGREKKASERWDTDYLAWALADFSGYLAADELYDGPFCVLSIVDNRTFKRLYFKVLDYDPTRDDVIAFFRRFQFALQARQLSVRGITTDGSPLYFEHRYLFVQHHLTDSERATLHRITRGLPHLRALRDITDEIYRLFDRYCRLTRDYVGSRATVSIFFKFIDTQGDTYD